MLASASTQRGSVSKESPSCRPVGKDNGERWSAVKGGVYLRAQDSVRKAGLAERWVQLGVLLVIGETLWPIPNVIGLGRFASLVGIGIASLVGRVPSFLDP